MKRNFDINYNRQLFFLLFSFFSCYQVNAASTIQKIDQEHVYSSIQFGNGLLDLRFPRAENPTMTEEPYIQSGKNNLIYVTLPQTLNTNAVNMEVYCPINSSVKVNGIPVPKNYGLLNGKDVAIVMTNVNIDANINLEITSQFGTKVEYDVLPKLGIKELDSIIYNFKEKYNIPGVSFAVVNVDSTKTVYQSGYGYAIKESKTRVQPSHLFRLASMSKQHTAVGILKLVEDGKIALNDTVFGPNGILKDKFPNVPNRATAITVRNLLEHTSGYSTHPDYMFDKLYTGWSMEQRIQAMLRSRQLNEPGAVFAYYNTGYGILGYIIETVSGKSYSQYMEDLYHSVGIDNIHVGGTQGERRPDEVAYYGQNSANAEGLDMGVRAPAGGLIASTDQLIKLLWRLDGKDNIPDLLNAETRQLMFTPSSTGRSRYTLGWRTNHQYFPQSFYHGGTLAGVATFWVYSGGYAVIFLCNSRSNIRRFDDEFYRMARDIIADVKEKQF